MKEIEHMENIENKMKKATLKLNEKEEEVIEILLDNKVFQINFTKEDQSNLRDFFKLCIELLLKEPFEFELVSNDTVKNQLVIKVAEDYIKDLNEEIRECVADINNLKLEEKTEKA